MYRDLKIYDSVRRLYEARKTYNEAKKYLDEVNKKESLYIRNFMFSNCQEKFFEIILSEGMNYYNNPVKLKVQEVVSRKIKWLLNKVKEGLTKEQYNKVVDKQYMIVDMPGLVKYLKSCGVNPKEFKKYLSVQETMNESKLEKAYDLGEVKRKQLEGCYEIVNSNPYIKITEMKQ